MANKREFKKYVDTVVSNLVSDMTYVCYMNEGVDASAIDSAAITLLRAAAIAMAKSNVKFDKSATAFDNTHDYHRARRHFYNEMFAKINKEFKSAVKEAMHQFNTAVPNAN